jgi:hypothetical protein
MSPKNTSNKAASGSGPADANNGASSHTGDNYKKPSDIAEAANDGHISIDSEASNIILPNGNGNATTTTSAVKGKLSVST